MKITNQHLLVLAVSLLASPALGQQSSPRLAPDTSASFPNTPPEARHRHSSTAAEGWLRGSAVRIQAEGNYILESSQAQVLSEHAESLHYDNYIKRGETALARRQTVDAYRDYKRQRKLARRKRGEQLRKQRDQQLARRYTLGEFEFNHETGTIHWPALVAGPRYSDLRTNTEIALHHIIATDSLEDAYYRKLLAKACKAFHRQLWEDYKTDVGKDSLLVKQEYAAMHRLLKGIKYLPINLTNTRPVSSTLAYK